MAENLVAKSNPISKKNTSLIQEFETHCFTDGLGKKRITKYVYSLRKLAEWLEKDFDQVSRKDIENLV